MSCSTSECSSLERFTLSLYFKVFCSGWWGRAPFLAPCELGWVSPVTFLAVLFLDMGSFSAGISDWGSLELSGAALSSPAHCDFQPLGLSWSPRSASSTQGDPRPLPRRHFWEILTFKANTKSPPVRSSLCSFLSPWEWENSVSCPVSGSFHVGAAVSVDRPPSRLLLLGHPGPAPGTRVQILWPTFLRVSWGLIPSMSFCRIFSFQARGSYVNMSFQASSRYRMWLSPSAS